ncbi:MAG: 2-hydroxyacyl-CoA dehydratase [Deltaproteobacteria bacterium]|nr:2-hydroxyacyl-CoA dehydratase [Deltaproteobacteria bacterium]
MLGRYFEELAAGLEAKLKQGDQEIIAKKNMALQTARLGARLYRHAGPIAWCGVATPFELMHALGVTSCFVEFVGAMLASSGAVGDALDAGEAAGLPSDLCSYHRAVQGAALLGWMPEPDFLVATSSPCSGGVATIEMLARRYGKELFVLHLPGRSDGEAVHYLAQQLAQLAEHVGSRLARPLQQSTLQQVLERADRASALLGEAFRLCRTVPTPARRNDMANLAFLMALLSGTEEGLQLATLYRDELARKVRDGVGGIAGERVRLAWFQNRIQFRSPLEQLLEEELGAAIVLDELNEVDWEPIAVQDFFTGLARKMLANPLSMPLSARIDRLARLAGEYRVDGVIAPCHWGCRQGTGARGLLTEGLRRAGFPVLNLEVDCIDPRPFSAGQLRTRLQAFVEMLAARRGRES